MYNLISNIIIHIVQLILVCYRSFIGIKRLDHVPNQEILATVKMPHIFNLVRKRQFGWLGHTLRFQEEHDPSRAFALYVPKHGTSRRARPTLTYKQEIAKSLSDSTEMLTNEHNVELAKVRKQCRKRLAILEPPKADHREIDRLYCKLKFFEKMLKFVLFLIY